MGLTTSKPIESKYILNNGKFQIKTIGGVNALNKNVTNGAFLTVSLHVKSRIHQKTKMYIIDNAFIKDLNKVIMYRDPGIAQEYNLPISRLTLNDVSWKAIGKAKILGSEILYKLKISCSPSGEYKFGEIATYIGGCIAWHVKGGSIPVYSNNMEEWLNVTRVDISIS